MRKVEQWKTPGTNNVHEDIIKLRKANTCLFKVEPTLVLPLATKHFHRLKICPQELSDSLNAVSIRLKEMVQRQDKDTILQLRELKELNNRMLELVEPVLRHYCKFKNPGEQSFTELHKAAYIMFYGIWIAMKRFSQTIEIYPLISYLETVPVPHLKETEEEDEIFETPLFSKKKYWPANLQAIHFCLRYTLLERKGIVDNLNKSFSTKKKALEVTSKYYGFETTSIANKFKEANELLDSCSFDMTKKYRAPLREITTNRQKQLYAVKNWLEREGYNEIAKEIVL